MVSGSSKNNQHDSLQRPEQVTLPGVVEMSYACLTPSDSTARLQRPVEAWTDCRYLQRCASGSNVERFKSLLRNLSINSDTSAILRHRGMPAWTATTAQRYGIVACRLQRSSTRSWTTLKAKQRPSCSLSKRQKFPSEALARLRSRSCWCSYARGNICRHARFELHCSRRNCKM